MNATTYRATRSQIRIPAGIFAGFAGGTPVESQGLRVLRQQEQR